MTNKQRRYAFSEASSYSDRDAYISDLAISSMWGDGPEEEIPADRLQELGHLWDAANLPMRELLAPCGTMANAAARFCIPYRTVQDWCADLHPCAPYVRLLIADALRDDTARTDPSISQ